MGLLFIAFHVYMYICEYEYEYEYSSTLFPTPEY